MRDYPENNSAGRCNSGKEKNPLKSIEIDEKICTGCGICVEFCPKKILVLSRKRNPGGICPAEVENLDACTKCRLCELYCPSFAISVEGEDDE